MKFNFVIQTEQKELPEGFYYVGQDNYYIANLNAPNRKHPGKYLFSDSATSCIIVIVEGKDRYHNPIVAISHLSRKDRFLYFFEIVDDTFVGKASVFAQGANPPSAKASIENVQTLLTWVTESICPDDFDRKKDDKPKCPDIAAKKGKKWWIDQLTLAVGQGNPQIDDRGCYGIDLSTMTVTNQRYVMTNLQRDPTGGIQTLFCVFGLKVEPKIVLHKAGEPFSQDEISRLVTKANEENWTDILYMTRDEVLEKYSSTPQEEAPWFYSTLRESALYVKNHSNQ